MVANEKLILLLKRLHLDANTNFASMDSLAFMSVVLEIEEDFSIKFDYSDLKPENFNSSASLLKLIQSKL